jgi:hypothetical protein
MVPLSQAELSAALAQPGVPEDHPLALLALDPIAQQALEDVAQGGLAGNRMLRQRRRGRPVTKAELERAKRAADATGVAGEELVNDYLTQRLDDGKIPAFNWASSENAISPYDFTILAADRGSQTTRIDVKATRGPFETSFHISLAEVVNAAGSTVPYVIYRVFGLTQGGGEISISGDIRDFARALQAAHDQAMPGQVTADSFSVPVSTPSLTWAQPVQAIFSVDED